MIARFRQIPKRFEAVVDFAIASLPKRPFSLETLFTQVFVH